MKIRIFALLISLAVLGISSCSYKTCPTYAQHSDKAPVTQKM
jgi:hypothetical protein